jgi:DivIVA domain-containing protein
MDLKSTLSVKFTPAEIKNRKFKTSAFGYSPKAVREFLELVADGQAMREQARVEAEKIFAEVEERANQIRRKTEEWLEEVIAEVEETQRQKLSFMTAFKSALDSHYELLERQPAEDQPIGARLNHLLKGGGAGDATH